MSDEHNPKRRERGPAARRPERLVPRRSLTHAWRLALLLVSGPPFHLKREASGSTAPYGDRAALASKVEKERTRFHRLSAEHMMERSDALHEAEERRQAANSVDRQISRGRARGEGHRCRDIRCSGAERRGDSAQLSPGDRAIGRDRPRDGLGRSARRPIFRLVRRTARPAPRRSVGDVRIRHDGEGQHRSQEPRVDRHRQIRGRLRLRNGALPTPTRRGEGAAIGPPGDGRLGAAHRRIRAGVYKLDRRLAVQHPAGT